MRDNSGVFAQRDDMQHELKLLAVCIAASIVFGGLAAYAVLNYLPQGDNRMIADFYSTEHAVSVSPADFTEHLAAGTLDGLVVDLRTPSEYAGGHLITAINIPVGSMDAKEAMDAFSALPKNETVILYCYSEYCMLSRNVGNVLAQNGIYVKHMTAGWYEIQRDFPSYVVNGSQPGVANATLGYAANVCAPTGNGKFSC